MSVSAERRAELGRRLAYVVAECARADGALLTHHTATHAHLPDEPGGALAHVRDRYRWES